MRILLMNRIDLHRRKILPSLNMPQYIQSPLLDIIDKRNQRTAGPRVIDEQQNLRPPELNMLFPRIQQQKIFPNLVENQRLANGPPLILTARRKQMEENEQDEAENDTRQRVNRIDNKHHKQG